MMKVIRSAPASGKSPKIICTGCGKKAVEAGIAVKPEAIEKGYSVAAKGSGLPEGPMMMIDDDDAYPLCEDCVTALLRKEEVAAAEGKTE
jgi:hypothetical protein